MGAVAGVAMIGGALISAHGQREAGKANEAIAKHNAYVGRMRAADSLQRGEQAAKDIKAQFKQLQSENRVGFATQNVQLGVGVSSAVEAETEYVAELESQRVLNDAAMEAWGYEQGAQESIMSGTLARNNSRYAVAGTLLSGVSAGAAQIHNSLPAKTSAKK